LLAVESSDIELAWKTFSDVYQPHRGVCAGFGLSKQNFTELFSAEDLREAIENGPQDADFSSLCSSCFQAFDTDENGLVDALEVLATLAMASKMSDAEKLEFVFNCYDFDGTGKLSLTELSLSMEFTLIGLCKMNNSVDPPDGQKLDDFNEDLFKDQLVAVSSSPTRVNSFYESSKRVSRGDFVKTLAGNAESASWVTYCAEISAPPATPVDVPQVAVNRRASHSAPAGDGVDAVMANNNGQVGRKASAAEIAGEATLILRRQSVEPSAAADATAVAAEAPAVEAAHDATLAAEKEAAEAVAAEQAATEATQAAEKEADEKAAAEQAAVEAEADTSPVEEAPKPEDEKADEPKAEAAAAPAEEAAPAAAEAVVEEAKTEAVEEPAAKEETPAAEAAAAPAEEAAPAAAEAVVDAAKPEAVEEPAATADSRAEAVPAQAAEPAAVPVVEANQEEAATPAKAEEPKAEAVQSAPVAAPAAKAEEPVQA
jgi:Ca2+-binding EF-hand superfamily protein